MAGVLRLEGPNRTRLLGAVVLGGIAGPVFLLFGLQLAAAASVSLWLNLELVATAILGHLVFRDHLSGLGWASVTGTVLAAVLLSWQGGAAGLRAGVLLAAACTCWGFDNHLTALVDGVKPQDTTFVKGIVAGTTNLAIGLSLGGFHAGPLAVTAAIAVGVLSYGASIVLYIMAAQGMGATRAQIVFASAPFFGVALSVAVLGEPLTPVQTAAAALLIVSILLMSRERHAHQHVHVAVEHEHWHRHDDGHHNHEHPGSPANVGHVHRHKHEALEHVHPHLADIHHRHEH
jgi:drug/metabolite transporter (DMT)-like permease